MMMDQWMEPDDAGEPALNKEFVASLRDLKVKTEYKLLNSLPCTILLNKASQFGLY
jgi:hypothetical protein